MCVRYVIITSINQSINQIYTYIAPPLEKLIKALYIITSTFYMTSHIAGMWAYIVDYSQVAALETISTWWRFIDNVNYNTFKR